MVKNLPVNTGDMSSIPGLGRSPGEGNGNLFYYSCLENPMNRGACHAVVHGVTKESDATGDQTTTGACRAQSELYDVFPYFHTYHSAEVLVFQRET